MFLDRVKINVRAGDGGDGASTFRREAHVPRGGPDGGDGGRGGSVYLAVDAGETTLRDFQYRHHFKATHGGRGERARRHGSAGHDLVVGVPPGTAVLDDATDELLADLV
ncbi:MAG TPA: GTPase ObgE, partial [Actinomycetota bacterium]|nr:GTPase ObgE [Actinomycetota bacterium]